MKITDVRTSIYSCPLATPVTDAKFATTHRCAVIAKVYTDDGIVGVGESSSFGGPPVVTATVIEKELRSYLIGEDPLDSSLIWDKMYYGSFEHGRRGLIISAMSGLDIALWDIKGKASGMPVHKILGGHSNSMKAYASMGFYAPGKGIKELTDEASLCIQKGFSALKVKIGGMSQKHDLERVEAIREAVGDEVDILVDANGSYSATDAIRMDRALDKFNILWFEEPVNADDTRGYVKVSENFNIPIAAGENLYTRYDFKDLIMTGAIDVVQPDTIWCGGLTEARRIADFANAFKISCAPHTFSSGVCLAANLHLLLSISNASMLEYDVNPNPLGVDLLDEPITIDEKGYVKAPSKPGLGISVNETAEKYSSEGLDPHM